MKDVTFRHGAKARVLVIDEKQPVADRVSQFLRRNGFDAKASYSTAEGFAISRFWIPTIILADVSGQGREVVESALGLCTAIPGCRLVLMFTDEADVNLINHYKKQGENFEMLPTPVDPQTLLDFLLELVEEKAA